MKRGMGVAAAAVFGSIGLVFVVASPTACSSKSCTPGQSVSCTGTGGCAGGQACNADGTGYGSCVCGAADSGADSATPDSSTNDVSNDVALPTHAALHVTWTVKQGSNTTTCANVGATTVDIALTPTGDAGALGDTTFACTAGTGDITGLTFGSYVVSASLLDNTQQSLASPAPQNVTLGSTGCDAIIGGDCAKNLTVTFSL